MSLTYRESGVNIDAGNQAVKEIASHVRRTLRPGVIGDIGGFGGLFGLDLKKYPDPILVSGTDGVGTKLRLAFLMDKHDTIGQDCVAMCVNDVAVQGAEPLFFLDYLAVGQLEPKRVADIVKGVADGCQLAGCALIGGETAEMPGMYKPDEYDIAGFCVGAVNRDRIIDGSRIRPGDAVVGLGSSGCHSNGYSLIRQVFFDRARWELNRYVSDLHGTLGEELLKPTRIYVKTILALIEDGHDLKGLAHITGGGLTENIPRALPDGCQVVLKRGSWPEPPVFGLIRRLGPVEEVEMQRAFNLGLGMVMVVPAEQAEAIVSRAKALGEAAYLIGEVAAGDKGVEVI